jgi:hypothetical protein
MPQAEASGAVSRPAADRGERELKFTLPDARAHLVRGRLEALCVRDSEFPTALVWTIYYDTPGLASLGEKVNSEFLKRKIRLRWYSDLEGHATGAVFLEAKFRVGTQRSKVRVLLSDRAETLANRDLQDPRLLELPRLLHAHGILPAGWWRPLMQIRYRRDRFVEPVSGSRISLDAGVSLTAVNRAALSAADRSPLGTAVLEVKGSGDQLPVSLRSLLPLGLRKRSFSKFLAVYAHATHQIL